MRTKSNTSKQKVVPVPAKVLGTIKHIEEAINKYGVKRMKKNLSEQGKILSPIPHKKTKNGRRKV